MAPSRKTVKRKPAGAGMLDQDAWELHKALSELVRIYQFRDRRRICYHDVSVAQCYALSAIIANGPMTLNALSSLLYLDKSTASRVIDALVKKGYVRRSADPGDGRAVKLEATGKGVSLHDRIEQDLVEEVKHLVAGFDPDVRQATTRLIASLAKAARTRFAGGGGGCARG